MMSGEQIERESDTDELDDDEYFHPIRLADLMPSSFSDRQKVVIIGALRNPGLSPSQLRDLIGLSVDVIDTVLLGFEHGTIGQRPAGNANVPERDGVQPSGYDEMTPKQQAMTRFFAKYPNARDKLNVTDLVEVIEIVEGTPVSTSYPDEFLSSYGDLIDAYRETMDESDIPDSELPDLDYGSIGHSVTIRERLENSGVERFPIESMDVDNEHDIDPADWLSEFDDYDAPQHEVSDVHRESASKYDMRALPTGWEWMCPVCDASFEKQRSFSGHFGNHDTPSKQKALRDWASAGDYAWVASFNYTIDRTAVALDLVDVLKSPYRDVVELARSSPSMSIDDIATRLRIETHQAEETLDKFGSAFSDNYTSERDDAEIDEKLMKSRDPSGEKNDSTDDATDESVRKTFSAYESGHRTLSGRPPGLDEQDDTDKKETSRDARAFVQSAANESSDVEQMLRTIRSMHRHAELEYDQRGTEAALSQLSLLEALLDEFDPEFDYDE